MLHFNYNSTFCRIRSTFSINSKKWVRRNLALFSLPAAAAGCAASMNGRGGVKLANINEQQRGCEVRNDSCERERRRSDEGTRWEGEGRGAPEGRLGGRLRVGLCRQCMRERAQLASNGRLIGQT